MIETKMNIFQKFKDKYKYLYLYYYIKFVPKLRLSVLNIEFTSYCNIKCKMCILDHSRPSGFLSEELLKKVLAEIDNPRKYYIKEIVINNAGETLLHPNLKGLLSIISERKKRSRNFPKVRLVTNTTLLTKEKSKIILESDVLDEIWFGMHRGYKQGYEEMQAGAKWEETINNIKDFLALQHEMNKKVRVGICSLSDQSKKDFAEEFKDIMSKMDTVLFVKPHKWDGSKKGAEQSLNQKGFCDFVLSDLAVLWDGRVCPCCIDLNGRGIIGDLNKQSLYDIFKGKERLAIIEAMKKNQRYKIKLCKNCDTVIDSNTNPAN